MGNRQNTAVPHNIKVFLRNQIENKTSEPFFIYAKFKGTERGVQLIRISGRIESVNIPAYIFCDNRITTTKRRLIHVTKYKVQLSSEILIVRIEEWSFKS